jgi:hypothetical protein
VAEEVEGRAGVDAADDRLDRNRAPEAAVVRFAAVVPAVASQDGLAGLRPARVRWSACHSTRAPGSVIAVDTRWLVESDLEGDTVDAVPVVEELEPVIVDSRQRAQITAAVNDWLFASHGRGKRSGLPR